MPGALPPAPAADTEMLRDEYGFLYSPQRKSPQPRSPANAKSKAKAKNKAKKRTSWFS